MRIVFSDSAPPSSNRLKPTELFGAIITELRASTGLSRDEIERRTGVNHATLRLAEQKPAIVRLTPKNAAAVLSLFSELRYAIWIDAGLVRSIQDRRVTIVRVIS